MKPIVTLTAVLALVSTPLLAQEATAPVDEGAALPDDGFVPLPDTLEEMTVGQVIGMNVVNDQAETIGEIDYVIAETEDVQGIIGIGGFLGLGEYTVAVDLDDMVYDSESRRLVLANVTADDLRAQPEYDESTVVGLPRETLISEIN